MPTAVLFYPDPEKGPSRFEFQESAWLQADVARIDGVQHVGVSGIKVEA